MSDKPLQERAGTNVGIEPTLFPFVQACAGRIIPINLSGDTLVMESTKQAARVPFRSFDGALGGWLWNTDPTFGTGKVVGFFFVDELGNEILIAISFGIPSAAITYIAFGFPSFNPAVFFCLAPGEKIIARIIPTPT